ncbi:MAG: hypothetical protein HN601_01425 [Candidatus Marinimicrobia bacterium]|nr:hypothetical protein [Candidatus Neomarinimicrobiota bacterium]
MYIPSKSFIDVASIAKDSSSKWSLQLDDEKRIFENLYLDFQTLDIMFIKNETINFVSVVDLDPHKIIQNYNYKWGIS